MGTPQQTRLSGPHCNVRLRCNTRCNACVRMYLQPSPMATAQEVSEDCLDGEPDEPTHPEVPCALHTLLHTPRALRRCRTVLRQHALAHGVVALEDLFTRPKPLGLTQTLSRDLVPCRPSNNDNACVCVRACVCACVRACVRVSCRVVSRRVASRRVASPLRLPCARACSQRIVGTLPTRQLSC